MDYIKITIDNEVLEKYNEYYFKMYPRRKKVPIPRPLQPSINEWMILPRMQMNALKQTWGEFGCWLIRSLGYQDIKLEKFEITITSYMPTRRRADPDNRNGKLILDSFTKSGFIVDDDGTHLLALTLKTRYDKEHPRTEIEVFIK